MELEDRVQAVLQLSADDLLNTQWPAPDIRKPSLNPCLVNMNKQNGRKTPDSPQSQEEFEQFQEEIQPKRPEISPWDR